MTVTLYNTRNLMHSTDRESGIIVNFRRTGAF